MGSIAAQIHSVSQCISLSSGTVLISYSEASGYSENIKPNANMTKLAILICSVVTGKKLKVYNKKDAKKYDSAKDDSVSYSHDLAIEFALI